jgi:mono/diheme cytochrome c family protein
MPRLSATSVLAMLFFTISVDAPAKNLPSSKENLGKADFLTYCAACHGVGGKGDGTVAEFLTINASNLTLLSKLNAGEFPIERVGSVIDGRADVKVHGPRDMPVWGDWFKVEANSSKAGKGASEKTVRDRINTLVRYIKSIQEK